jgi:hypothetical protein
MAANVFVSNVRPAPVSAFGDASRTESSADFVRNPRYVTPGGASASTRVNAASTARPTWPDFPGNRTVIAAIGSTFSAR